MAVANQKKTKKVACPLTRAEFREKAKPVKVTIGDTTIEMDPREFSTLSLGWNASQRIMVEIDGKRVPCQLGLNLTVNGSKDLPK